MSSNEEARGRKGMQNLGESRLLYELFDASLVIYWVLLVYVRHLGRVFMGKA